MKYSKETAQAIADALATGDHTIAQVCATVGISESTFFKWKVEKSEFSESLKKAETARLAALGQLARAGLALLLTTQEVEEVTTDFGLDKEGKPHQRSRKVTKRKILPHATAVVFALKNLDSDNFKDKHEVEHSGEMAMTWNETRTYAQPAPADGTHP